MRVYLIFFMLAFPAQLLSQVKTEKSFLTEDMSECDSADAYYVAYKTYSDTNTKAGIIKTTYADGSLYSEVEYANMEKKQLYGHSRYYHKNGNLKSHVYREKSKGGMSVMHGELLTYHENGQLKRKEMYDHGELKYGNCYTSNGDDTAHFDYEVMPEFPGGEEKLMKFLIKNIHYPPDALEEGVSGRVFVSFKIDKNGKIKNEKILRSPHPSLSEEALRVVRRMEDWKPGLQDGDTVSVYYNLPINFTLR